MRRQSWIAVRNVNARSKRLGKFEHLSLADRHLLGNWNEVCEPFCDPSSRMQRSSISAMTRSRFQKAPQASYSIH